MRTYCWNLLNIRGFTLFICEMSKIWKSSISIPDGVTITVSWQSVTVVWPKWQLSYTVLDCITIQKDDTSISFSIWNDEDKKFWGLTRTLVANMVEWVVSWYEKKLLILGVWFAAKVEGTNLILNVWFSHPVSYAIASWITLTVDKDPKWNPTLLVSWIDKQLVWQTAAQIRDIKRPEPYKWKGIRYANEIVKMKAWKTSKK